MTNKKSGKMAYPKIPNQIWTRVTLKAERYPNKEPNQRDMNVVLGTSCVSKKVYCEIK